MRTILTRLLLAAAVFVLIAPKASADDVLHIFAAASLKTALDEVILGWNAAHPEVTAVGVYAATSALARQIEEGAPADVFVSADRDWMDELEKNALIRSGSRRDLLTNTLVLIAPAGSADAGGRSPVELIEARLGDGRLAVGKTNSVPAGKYARQALASLGIWDKVKDRLAEQVNVRAALQLVARGEAPLGIVYGSDAQASRSVSVLAVFPQPSHTPIIYPAAVTAASNIPQAADFLGALISPEAAGIFVANGFGIAR